MKLHHPRVLSQALIFVLAACLMVILFVSPLQRTRAQSAGFALLFDGIADMVQLPDIISVMGEGYTDTKSLSVWVKPTGPALCAGPDVADCPIIFSQKPHYWGIGIGVVPTGPLAGQDRIWVWNFDGEQDWVAIPYTPNEWVNITLVHANGRLYGYANGELIGSEASGTTQLDPLEPGILYLGGLPPDEQSWFFTGLIDEVRLWDRALSVEEIVANLSNPLLGNETGLVAYYTMSDGEGLVLTDDGEFTEWNGTLIGPPEWVDSSAFDPINTRTPTPSSTPTLTLTPTQTSTPSPTPTATRTRTPTATPTQTSTGTVTQTPTPTRTRIPGMDIELFLPKVLRNFP